MADANLYLDRIDFSSYLSGSECRKCGVDSCKDLIDRLRRRACLPEELTGLAGDKRKALRSALDLEGALPSVPTLLMPRPASVGLVELNKPRPGDPVLVTGNNQFTQEVLLSVLATTAAPLFLLCTDTRGDTLDMAVILKSFTPERIAESARREHLSDRAASSTLIIPGLAAALGDAIAEACGFPVQVGPVCAAELPLFFRDRWTCAPSQTPG